MQESKISVNDAVVTDFSYEVVNWDVISVMGVDGSPFVVSVWHTQEKRLISFNKPVGYVVSAADQYNQTIYDILPPEFSRFRYIGRLDKDSRWLLLLSNDLDLVHAYSHPSFASEKKYIVQVDRNFAESDIVKMESWVVDWDDILRATHIDIQDDPKTIVVALQEGKNRHIRRMLSVLWYDVVDLCRISQWAIILWDLAEGDWRYESL